MGILKSYSPRVGISGRTGEVQMPDFAGQSMRDIGSVAMGISKDYLNRKADAKLSADKADYETSLITLNGQIEQKMNDAMAGGMSYKDVHDKVVAPEVDRFKSNIQNQGFSEAGNSYAQNNFKTDGAKIISGSIGFREKRELEEINESNKQGYFTAKAAGDTVSADEYLGKIRNMAGSKAANDVAELGEYNREYNDIFDLTTVEDVQNYSVETKNPSHRQALETFKRNRIGGIISEGTRTYMGTQSQMLKSASEFTMNEQQIVMAEEAGMPEKTGDAWRSSLSNAPDNKTDVIKATSFVERYKDPNDKLSMDKAIQKVLGYNNVSLSTKSRLVQEILDSGEAMGAKGYTTNIGVGIFGAGSGIDTKVTTGYRSSAEQTAFTEFTDTFERALSMARDEDQYKEIVDAQLDRREELVKFSRDFDEGMTDKDWAEKRSDILGIPAQKIVESLVAPQINAKEEIDTKSIWDSI